MQYRRVGNSGLEVSAVSIGGWLTFGGTIQDDTAGDIVRAAIESGVNFVDLADIYARGKAEEAFAKVLPDFPRHELVVSSKCFWPMSDHPNDKGLSRKHVIESCERTLRRLGTDYLDLYFCHREDPSVPLEETVRAMDDLVRQGKVLYWGTSVWSPAALQRSHDLADRYNAYAPTVEQPQYNLLVRDIEAEVLPTVRRLGMGLVVWSPLAGGFLTGKYDDGVPEGSRATNSQWMERYLTDENLARSRTFSAIARELDATPGQLALAWCLSHPEVSCVITGATHPDHVRSNVAAAELVVPADVLARLDELFPAPGAEE